MDGNTAARCVMPRLLLSDGRTERLGTSVFHPRNFGRSVTPGCGSTGANRKRDSVRKSLPARELSATQKRPDAPARMLTSKTSTAYLLKNMSGCLQNRQGYVRSADALSGSSFVRRSLTSLSITVTTPDVSGVCCAGTATQALADSVTQLRGWSGQSPICVGER